MLGSVISGAQVSQRIRPYKETTWRNKTFPEGELQKRDLSHFENLPEDVKAGVIEATKYKEAYLYEFRHFIGRHKKIVHGYLLTRRSKYRVNKQLAYRLFVTGKSAKSKEVMETIFHAFGQDDKPGLVVKTGDAEFDKILEQKGGFYFQLNGSTDLIINMPLNKYSNPLTFYPLTSEKSREILALTNPEADSHLVFGIKHPFETNKSRVKAKMLGAIVLSKQVDDASYQAEGYCSTNDAAEKIMASLYSSIKEKLETEH